MPNAKDYKPSESGLMVDIIGPPGSGKSHFIRSGLRLGKGVLFLAPATELASYAGDDVEYEVIQDPEWRPLEGKYVAQGHGFLLKKLGELEGRKDLKLIALDTASAIFDCTGHAVLAPQRVDNPQELSNPFSFYASFRNRVQEVLERLNYLRYKLGCHVIVAWHEDVREVEGLGVLRKEQDKGKTVLHWDAAKTPMLAGSLRNDIGKWFDAHLYAEPVVDSKPFRCRVHALPTKTQLAKTRLRIVEALQKMPEVSNDFPTLVELVKKAYSTGGGGDVR